MKRAVFIVNPISGTTKKKNIPDVIASTIDKSVFDYEIVYTAYSGHATVLAAKACSEGADVVVAVGGDGTVNEVGRAIINTETAMGIIPCGSGNGLARHLLLPINVKRSIGVM